MMRPQGFRPVACAILLGLGLAAGPVPAQEEPEMGIVQSDVLTIDTERLFLETDLGKAVRDRFEAERAALAEKSDRIVNDLETEEQQLTDTRAQMTPEAFRALADAFDEKVQQIRRDNERLGLEFERRRDQAPRIFLQQVQPVLVDLMQEANAVVILDTGAVLLGIEQIDVTDRAIARVNALAPTDRLGTAAP